MTEMFHSLAVGLALSVVVILVLLTGYFQSFRLGLISIGGVPGVVCGVVLILLATGTTLNIESFMGSIMCIGVSVSNSVLLTTFMDHHWRAGASVPQAAVEGCPRPPAADSDDGHRHDVGHACPWPWPWKKEADDGALGTGGDRRTGGLDLRHAVDRAGHVRAGDGRGEEGLALARPGRCLAAGITIPREHEARGHPPRASTRKTSNLTGSFVMRNLLSLGMSRCSSRRSAGTALSALFLPLAPLGRLPQRGSRSKASGEREPGRPQREADAAEHRLPGRSARLRRRL